MHLDSTREKMLRGDMGEAKQFATKIVTKVGDAMEPDFLVPIKSAHVLAHCSSLHDAGVNPSTRRETNIRSDIRGATVKGEVLFYPFGKHLTTGSSWYLETRRLENHPLAIATGVDLSTIVGSVLASLIHEKGIPVMAGVSTSSCDRVTSGIEVSLDANIGEVRVED